MAQFNQAQLQAALRARRLQPIELDTSFRDRDGYIPPGMVMHESFAGRTATFLGGPVTEVPGGEGFELVSDGRLGIYRIVRRERTSETVRYHLCGCGPPARGAQPTLRQLFYRIPDGHTYHGEIQLPLEVRAVEVRWAEDGRGRCPEASAMARRRQAP